MTMDDGCLWTVMDDGCYDGMMGGDDDEGSSGCR